jgi:hypothetical protein
MDGEFAMEPMEEEAASGLGARIVGKINELISPMIARLMSLGKLRRKGGLSSLNAKSQDLRHRITA